MKRCKALEMGIEALQILRAGYVFDRQNLYVGDVNSGPAMRTLKKIAKTDKAIIRLRKETETSCK